MNAGAFEAHETHLAPLGDGHFLDEGVFDGALGPEGFFERADEVAEDVERFAFHDDGFGEHAVTEVVAGSGDAFTARTPEAAATPPRPRTEAQ